MCHNLRSKLVGLLLLGYLAICPLSHSASAAVPHLVRY